MCYFILFNFYATWIYYWSRQSPYDDNIRNNTIIWWVCLGLLAYFLLFVSFGRLISTGVKRFFFRDFWNIYDLVSFGLNLAIIICDVADVEFEKTNAICCPAVGLMWIKTFYYLKIFPQFSTLIWLVETVMWDMKAFLVVFFIAIFAFANAFYILGFNKLNTSDPNFAEENYSGKNFVLAIIYSYW